MLANDEFPRGLTLSVNQAGVTTLTFPATPGVAWVLAGIQAAYGASIGASQNITTTVTAASGTTNGPIVPMSGYFTANEYLQLEGSWSGQWAGGVGESLTVTMTSGQAGGQCSMIATAYPA